MTNDRPYQRARSAAEAHAELTSGAAAQFDPDLVGLFASIDGEEAGDRAMAGGSADVLVATRGLRMAPDAA